MMQSQTDQNLPVSKIMTFLENKYKIAKELQNFA
jgi:hypothetical protein